MRPYLRVILLCFFIMTISSCKDQTSGYACLGENNDTLVESFQDQCKKGDTVVTKHPAYFCDFNYSVAYNDYNSAYCIFNGELRPERLLE